MSVNCLQHQTRQFAKPGEFVGSALGVRSGLLPNNSSCSLVDILIVAVSKLSNVGAATVCLAGVTLLL